MKRTISVFSFFFGDDVFISYARKDGRAYAARLAKLLSDKKFDVFYDQLGTPRGAEVPASVLKRCGRARLLVVVGTPEARMSSHVGKEIAAFPADRRGVLLIVFGEEGMSDWDKVQGVAKVIETPGAFDRGECSPDVTKNFEDAATFVRRRTIQLVTSAFFVALIVSGAAAALSEARQVLTARVELQATASKLEKAETDLVQRQADLRKTQSQIIEAEAGAALANTSVPGAERKSLEMALQSAKDADARRIEPASIVHSALVAAIVMAQRAVTLKEDAHFAESLTFSTDGKRLIAHSHYHDGSIWTLGEDHDKNRSSEEQPVAARLALLQREFDGSKHQIPIRLTTKERLLPADGEEKGESVWQLSADGDWALSPARAAGSRVRFDLWTTGTGRHVASLESKSGFVRAPQFSERGSRLYFIDHDGRGHLVDLSAPRMKREIWASPVDRWGLQVSPSGTRIIVEPDFLHRVDAKEIQCIKTQLGATTHPVNAKGIGANFLTDDLAELRTIEPRETRLWNCETGAQLLLDDVAPAKEGIHEEERWLFIAGDYIAAVGHLENEDRTQSDGYLTVWRRGNGQLSLRRQFSLLPASLRGEHLIYADAIHGTGIGNALAAVWGGDSIIRIFDLSTGRLTNSLIGHHGVVLAVARSPDGEGLASTASDGEVRLWHLRDGVRLSRYEIPGRTESDYVLPHVCLETGGERLAVVGRSGLEFWSPGGLSPVRTVSFKRFLTKVELREVTEGAFPFLQCSAYQFLAGDRRFDFSGDFAPKSNGDSDWPHAFRIDGDLTVRMNDSVGPLELTATNREGKQVARWHLEADEEINAPLAISSMRDRIAVAVSKGLVHILDSRSLKEVIPAIQTTEGVRAAEFSPDGQWILTVEDDERHRGGARVWDVASGALVFDIQAVGTSVTQATFSADGASIVYLCDDGDLRKIPVELDRLKSSASAILRR